MRALITGISGFVGQKLANHLIVDKGWEVWGFSRSQHPDTLSAKASLINVRWNQGNIFEHIEAVKPDVIFHLAAQSNVKQSWEDKVETFESNVILTIELLEAVRQSSIAQEVRVVTIGSAEEYGQVADPSVPISETTALNPSSPYGVSKAAVSMLARQYYEAYGLQVIHLRPFNHIGPGQALGFVLPDFAHQVASIEAGRQEPIIKVGDLSAKRDFLDVRDIVQMYSSLSTMGLSGEVYNVCTGQATEIRSILDIMIQLSTVKIQVETDPERLRPVDVPVYVGSNVKIEKLGLQPSIPLVNSIREILDYWRTVISDKGRIYT